MDKETSGTTNLKEASVYPQEKQIRNYQCNNYDKHSSLEYHTSIHSDFNDKVPTYCSDSFCEYRTLVTEFGL